MPRHDIDVIEVRKGTPSSKLTRDEFRTRFRAQFVDPAFDALGEHIVALEAAAWDAYDHGRKSPHTRRAGEGFADPSYELSVDWLASREAIRAAQVRHDGDAPPRILVIGGGSRNGNTCPGELSKTQRLIEEASAELRARHFGVDYLDLSRVTAEYGLEIHPCKGCVSTAMPLCHWPCSCYPNHGLGQSRDWMAEIYPLWVAAHGILIVTPTYWHQAPSPLKLMLDRLVCADGGNPDPTTTHGKDAAKAKAIELAGWDYPRHLKGRAFGLYVHGDSEGAESLRRALHDTLTDMELESAGGKAELDRYIGYYEPYATSHEALDDAPPLREVRNVAATLAERVSLLRTQRLRPGDDTIDPRPK
ncbi:MAG TPA: flavodoxin family protein [Kofleriaceae bacterium]